jgi:hypothetical protein
LRKDHCALAKARCVSWTLDHAAEHRVSEAAPVVDQGQRDRLLSLGEVAAHRLRIPARDRQVAVGIDPLHIDHRAQAVIAIDEVASQERAVGRAAQLAGYAPVLV